MYTGTTVLFQGIYRGQNLTFDYRPSLKASRRWAGSTAQRAVHPHDTQTAELNS